MQHLGVIGLGTMGANLARNAASRGATVAVFNRTTETTHEFMKTHEKEGKFVACVTYTDLLKALPQPRAILIMVKAGDAVDTVITDLLPNLSKGDVLIDGGNSLYTDTEKRAKSLSEKGIHFVGMGVSGGEEGALKGPSMMPGGSKEGFDLVKDLLEKMAADDGVGGKCVSFIGSGGSGHFVKMVHNGMEYGMMQLLAESYDVLKTLGGYSNEQLAETFAAWNETEELKSFLMEITAKIFTVKDDQKKTGWLIDMIKDAAGQKGTGKWTTNAALDLGVAIPTINAAVDARIISGDSMYRSVCKTLPETLDTGEPMPQSEKLRSIVRSSLELSMMLCYEQGFGLMMKASEAYGWDLQHSETARIWRGGCIIRAAYLAKLQAAFSKDKHTSEAASEAIMERFRGERQKDFRTLIQLTASRGLPAPALSASLNYYDSYRKEKLPQNLIQAQRDFFGAHTFERIDKEGVFHADWN